MPAELPGELAELDCAPPQPLKNAAEAKKTNVKIRCVITLINLGTFLNSNAGLSVASPEDSDGEQTGTGR